MRAGKKRPKQSAGDKGAGPKRFVVRRKRFCKFCADKTDYIDFKDTRLLAPFVPERGKILPRRISGVCATHQRKLGEAIKRARHLALIPSVAD